MLKYDVRVDIKTILLNNNCRQFRMRSDNGMPDRLKLVTYEKSATAVLCKTVL